MQRLPDDKFEMVMHTLYFKPDLWVEESEVKKKSSPNVFDITNWLVEDYKPKTDFWMYIND